MNIWSDIALILLNETIVQTYQKYEVTVSKKNMFKVSWSKVGLIGNRTSPKAHPRRISFLFIWGWHGPNFIY
jgi:hypothetical protein